MNLIKVYVAWVLLFVLMFGLFTVGTVFADFPSNWGVEPVLSYSTYPYRFLIRNENNEIKYIASKQKWQVVKISGIEHLYDMQDIVPSGETYSFRAYDVVFTGTAINYNYRGSTYSAKGNDNVKYKHDILYSNFNVNSILDIDGTFLEVFHESDESTLTGTCIYLSPAEGFQDNVNIFSFLADYAINIPSGGDKSKLAIDVTGGVAGTGDVISHDFRTVGGQWKGQLRFTRNLNPGTNSIKLSIKYDGKTVVSAVRNVIYYTDFIDVDEDGLDDRTGQPEFIPTMPDYTNPSDIGNWLNDSINDMGNFITNSASWISNVTNFYNIIFGFLPVEIRGGITVLISVIIIFTILKVIRG